MCATAEPTEGGVRGVGAVAFRINRLEQPQVDRWNVGLGILVWVRTPFSHAEIGIATSIGRHCHLGNKSADAVVEVIRGLRPNESLLPHRRGVELHGAVHHRYRVCVPGDLHRRAVQIEGALRMDLTRAACYEHT